MSNLSTKAPKTSERTSKVLTQLDSNANKHAISEMEKEDHKEKSAPSNNQNENVLSDQEIESEIDKMIDKRRKCVTSVSDADISRHQDLGMHQSQKTP